MKKFIKHFIVWYLIQKCNAVFEYNGKVVRVFSADFYEKRIREYCDALKRSENNDRQRKTD